MSIRCRLPELRARHGRITLSKLSEDTGISLANLSRLDRSLTTRIDLGTLETLCRYFKVTPGELLELVDEPSQAATPATEEAAR